MHASYVHLDIKELLDASPAKVSPKWSKIFWAFVLVGIVAFIVGSLTRPSAEIWAIYWVNTVFFTGLSCGGVMTSVIFQIVRAKWSAPIRRLGESASSFLPVSYVLILFSWFGKEELWPWGSAPFPGREMWFEPWWVFVRFAVLLGILFYAMHRFVDLSLRGDVGLAKERAPKDPRWNTWWCSRLIGNWKGAEFEIPHIQRTMSCRAPVVVGLYMFFYSLFVFDMIMATDAIWFSNMMGGWIFCSNIYIAWGFLALMTVIVSKGNKAVDNHTNQDHLWDTAKLMFGFAMLWGYMTLAQFLPQWYGNLPEETQWMILRTREWPWKGMSYLTLSSAFFIPFILLVSRDLKRTPKFLVPVIGLIWFGVWMDKYMLLMPQYSPTRVPFNLVEIGSFIGFLGIFALCVRGFLSRYPVAIVSSPLGQGRTDW